MCLFLRLLSGILIVFRCYILMILCLVLSLFWGYFRLLWCYFRSSLFFFKYLVIYCATLILFLSVVFAILRPCWYYFLLFEFISLLFRATLTICLSMFEASLGYLEATSELYLNDFEHNFWRYFEVISRYFKITLEQFRVFLK